MTSRLFRILTVSTTLLVSSCLASLVMAGECDAGKAATMSSFADEVITVSTTALPFTSSKYSPSPSTGSGGGALMAFVTSENDNFRFWMSGSTPTSSQGHQVLAGASVVICGDNIARFKAIRSGSADVTLQVSYLRLPQ